MSNPTKRREFVWKIVPMAGAMFVLPRLAHADVPALAEEDKMAMTMGFHLHTEKTDQAKYPKHKADQSCANCLHYTTPAADTARCDIFNKMVPKTGWCSAYSHRP